jgi:hypothetical protein
MLRWGFDELRLSGRLRKFQFPLVPSLRQPDAARIFAKYPRLAPAELVEAPAPPFR